MFKDDTTLEAALYRYKLGIDRLEVHQKFEPPVSSHLKWRDRFMLRLGRTLVIVGSRLQKRYGEAAPAVYHPAYPTG